MTMGILTTAALCATLAAAPPAGEPPQAPAAPAPAPPPPPTPPMDVEGAIEDVWVYLRDKYDSDRDGRVSRQEYTRDDAAFLRLDADGDGVITEDDLTNSSARRERRGDQRPRRPPGDGGVARRPMAAPIAGAMAPDFTLQPLKGGEPVTLSGFRGAKPVALIFGSYT
jgi:hypothetical protein